MTEFKGEQQAEATNQLTAKLQAFYDGLSDDERAMCIIGVRQLVTDEESDARGFMINHRVESPEPLPEEPNRLIPYRINGPTLYTQITPTYQVSR
jgi:hypothetical protein